MLGSSNETFTALHTLQCWDGSNPCSDGFPEQNTIAQGKVKTDFGSAILTIHIHVHMCFADFSEQRGENMCTLTFNWPKFMKHFNVLSCEVDAFEFKGDYVFFGQCGL